MLLRAVDSAAAIRPGGRGESVELLEAMKKAFETIATAKVSPPRQRRLADWDFCTSSDHVTMNRERVLADAKESCARSWCALDTSLRRFGKDIPAPGENILAALRLGVHIMRQGDYISDHEVKIATKVAEVFVRRVCDLGHACKRAVFVRSGTRGSLSHCAARRRRKSGFSTP